MAAPLRVIVLVLGVIQLLLRGDIGNQIVLFNKIAVSLRKENLVVINHRASPGDAKRQINLFNMLVVDDVFQLLADGDRPVVLVVDQVVFFDGVNHNLLASGHIP